MGYGYGYCCCGSPSCGQAYFFPRRDYKLENLNYPNNDGNRWHIVPDGILSFTGYQLGHADPADDPGSFFSVMTELNRLGTEQFDIRWQVSYPFADDGITHGTNSKVGVFVASAFVVWVDFSDNTLRFSTTTDAAGSIPGSGTLAYQFTYVPFQQEAQVTLFRTPSGLWNVEFKDPNDPGSTIAWSTILGVTIPGLDTGAIIWGGTIGPGGGVIGKMRLNCNNEAACYGCEIGMQLQFTQSMDTGGSDLSSGGGPFIHYGCCGWFTQSPAALKSAITQIQIGLDFAGAPQMQDLRSNDVTLWMLPPNWVLNTGHMNGIFPIQDRLYLCAVADAWDVAHDLHNQYVLHVWTCMATDFCCYGVSTFTSETMPSLFGMVVPCTSLGISSFQQFSWPRVVTVTAVQQLSDEVSLNCPYTLPWVAVGSPLRWAVGYPSPDVYFRCDTGGGVLGPPPPFDPQYFAQVAYTLCAN